MKDNNNIIKKLNRLNLPQVELNSHRQKLRLALMARHNRFNSDYFKINNLMFNTKKFTPVGAIALIAIIAVVSIISLTGNPSPVSAKEIAEKSFQVVANLSPEDKTALKIKTGLDQFALEEAKQAEDLKVLTYDELTNNYPELNDDINTMVMFPADSNKNDVLKHLTFLQYTKKFDGQVKKIILAINTENDLPVFGYAESTHENGMFITEFFGKYQPGSVNNEGVEYGYDYSINNEKIKCETLDNGQVECDSEIEMHEISIDETVNGQNIPNLLIQKVKCKILEDGKVLCDEESSTNGMEIKIEDKGLILQEDAKDFQKPGELPQAYSIKDIAE